MFFKPDNEAEIEIWDSIRPNEFNALESIYYVSKLENKNHLIKGNFLNFLTYLWTETNRFTKYDDMKSVIIFKLYKTVVDEFQGSKHIFNTQENNIDILITLYISIMQNTLDIYDARMHLQEFNNKSIHPIMSLNNFVMLAGFLAECAAVSYLNKYISEDSNMKVLMNTINFYCLANFIGYKIRNTDR